MLVHAIAQKYNYLIEHVTSARVKTEKNVKAMLSSALKRNNNIIILIDDISDRSQPILEMFLDQMNVLLKQPGCNVLLFACTNKPHKLSYRTYKRLVLQTT